MVEWIQNFLAAYVGQAIGNLALFGLVYLVTRRWAAKWLAGRRIENRGQTDRAQLLHELRYTLGTFAFATAQLLAVQGLQAQGLTRLGVEAGLFGNLAAFVGLILFNDLWFYGVHRLLHHPRLYKHIHAVHHRSVDVNPFSSYSFHWVEAILLTGWVLPAMLLVPLPLPALMAAQVAGLANNLMAHLGYELLPRGWLRIPVLSWSNSATFHSLHHSYFKGNYGLFTRLWDRLFGTELPGYEEAFAQAHRAAPKSTE